MRYMFCYLSPPLCLDPTLPPCLSVVRAITAPHHHLQHHHLPAPARNPSFPITWPWPSCSIPPSFRPISPIAMFHSLGPIIDSPLMIGLPPRSLFIRRLASPLLNLTVTTQSIFWRSLHPPLSPSTCRRRSRFSHRSALCPSVRFLVSSGC